SIRGGARRAADILSTLRPFCVSMTASGQRDTKLPPPRIPQRRAAKNDRPRVGSGPLALEHFPRHSLRSLSRMQAYPHGRRYLTLADTVEADAGTHMVGRCPRHLPYAMPAGSGSGVWELLRPSGSVP